MRAHNVPRLPVKTVAIFCGESKPLSLDEYLAKFVKEMNRLQANGLRIGNRVYWVKLREIIADSPARAYIKGVKAFNAVEGCQKCTIRTEYDARTRRRFFRYGTIARSRTDKEFLENKYWEHCTKTTPLLKLKQCNMIRSFPGSERMHFADKGVFGKLTHLLPSDLKRRLRDLRYIEHWKASEHKMLLQVAGVAVLKDRLKPEM
uniref:Uncharacterized protein n=1 Tax=Anopheles arabiensis TaxID=7173 RepID=A0A182HQF4_ANOAR